MAFTERPLCVRDAEASQQVPAPPDLPTVPGPCSRPLSKAVGRQASGPGLGPLLRMLAPRGAGGLAKPGVSPSFSETAIQPVPGTEKHRAWKQQGAAPAALLPS